MTSPTHKTTSPDVRSNISKLIGAIQRGSNDALILELALTPGVIDGFESMWKADFFHYAVAKCSPYVVETLINNGCYAEKRAKQHNLTPSEVAAKRYKTKQDESSKMVQDIVNQPKKDLEKIQFMVLYYEVKCSPATKVSDNLLKVYQKATNEGLNSLQVLNMLGDHLSEIYGVSKENYQEFVSKLRTIEVKEEMGFFDSLAASNDFYKLYEELINSSKGEDPSNTLEEVSLIAKNGEEDGPVI